MIVVIIFTWSPPMLVLSLKSNLLQNRVSAPADQTLLLHCSSGGK